MYFVRINVVSKLSSGLGMRFKYEFVVREPFL